MSNLNYRITAYPYKDGDEIYWVAKAAEFPGVPGVGATRDEALADLDLALTETIAFLQEKGKAIPEEYVYTPDDVSGRFTVRVPKTLHRELVQEAEEEGVSLNQYMLYVLSKRHEMFPKSLALSLMASLPVSSVIAEPLRDDAARKSGSTLSEQP